MTPTLIFFQVHNGQLCALGLPFQHRVRAASEINRNDGTVILFTGGKGESLKASRFAQQEFGVPSTSCLTEDTSTTTMENARESFRIVSETFDRPHNINILVVSDFYHVLRCKLLFQKYFPNVRVLSTRANLANNLFGLMREMGGLAKNYLQGYYTLDDIWRELTQKGSV
ncbi:hypothetical protein PROFUN_11823 [Planoprotostelium fungivorum]|uniref:DUF218 domain-containing protein n=1 Tax=Planoprotostelium fungivorum TaxID=1890364 RepID=A0A2P6N997_9EUKA|nr:hypothetical protein PROFUN_11823 [Planoprotostelium fungivorum]